jgi:vacuolar-type H+-ATPase subunit I/STV1
MNKHFEDTQYYLKRAGETAKRGVAEELDTVEERVRSLAGQEEVEPGRIEELRAELDRIAEHAEAEATERIERARGKLDEYRQSPAQ